jgi:hypothetical protein
MLIHFFVDLSLVHDKALTIDLIQCFGYIFSQSVFQGLVAVFMLVNSFTPNSISFSLSSEFMLKTPLLSREVGCVSKKRYIPCFRGMIVPDRSYSSHRAVVFHWLPFELWHQVFGFYFCVLSGKGGVMLRSQLSISHVYRSWRTIVLCTPFFWSRLDIDASIRPEFLDYGYIFDPMYPAAILSLEADIFVQLDLG